MTPDKPGEPDAEAHREDVPTIDGRDRRWQWRVELGYLLELAALCGFVFTQPVLDTFGRSPETFIAHNASRTDILLFALIWAAGPALALWLLAQISHLGGERWRGRVHVGAIALLLAALAFVILQGTVGWHLALIAVLAVAVGAAAIRLYLRATWAVSYLRIASIAPVAFAALFVFASPTSPLIFGKATGAADVDIAGDAPDVVFVVLDMLPTVSLLDGNGAIDADLYPNFGRLAADSTWYRNASTAAPWTNMALPTIVAGRYPDSAGTAPVAERYPHSIFTLLGGTYDLHVSEVITRLCPYSLCPPERHGGALAGLFGEGVDVISEKAWEQGPFPFEMAKVLDADRPKVFEDFVASIEPGAAPTLHFLHSLLPHDPWNLLPNGVEYAAPDIPPGLWFANWAGDHAAAIGHQRHILQTQLVDRLLGGLLDHLEETGLYDDTLIVVTADHGVAFTSPERWRGVSDANFEQIAYVPLFVKEPGQTRGRVDDTNVMSIDFLPSIADLLGVELPDDWEPDGRSFVSGEPRGPEEKRIFEWNANELEPTDGNLVVLDAVEGLRRVTSFPAAVPGDDELRVWRQGALGHLVGTPVEAMTVGPPVDYEVTSSDRSAFDDVDLGDRPPLHLHAELSRGPGVPVAVAVNGTIAGWAPTSGFETERAEFWTLLAAPLFRAGANEVECFAVEETADDVVLHPIPWRR